MNDMLRRWLSWRRVAGVAALLAAAVVALLASSFGGCSHTSPRTAIAASKFTGDEQELLVTGYCNCGRCCGWRKKWYFFGEPVYNYGKMKGAPKKVGVTASGEVAMKGTIAADPAVFPFGTRMEIPGYGFGIVQDIGGAIKGAHVDIWFPTHEEAGAWGARRIKVKVERSKSPRQATPI